ncbi:flippase, partial [archaeon]|nr:flippase [archaeon]
KIIKESFIMFLIYSLTYPMGYLLRLIFAKNLSVEDFGLFYSVMAFVNFFIIFRDFGLSECLMTYLPKYKVENRPDKIKGSILFVLSFQFIIAVIIASFLIFMSGFLSVNFFKTKKATLVLVVFAIMFIINGFVEVLNLSLIGLGKPRFKAISDFFHSLIMLISSFFIFLFMSGTIAPTISYTITRVFLVIVLVFFFLSTFRFFKYRAYLDKKMIKEFITYSLKLLIGTGASIILTSFIVNMLTFYGGVEQVGIYGVAFPTASLLALFSKSVSLIMSPYSSEQWTKGRKDKIKEIIEISYSYLIIIVIPFLFILFSYSDLIIGLIFGKQFLVMTTQIFGYTITLASISLKILLFAVLFSMFNSMNMSVIAAIRKPFEVTKTVYVGAIVNFLFSILLIPKFGIIGASISYVFSVLSLIIVSLYYIKKFIGARFPYKKWLKGFFAGIIFLIAMSLSKNYININVYLEAILITSFSGLIYLGMIFILGLIKISEVKYILNVGMKMFKNKNFKIEDLDSE